jgi:hypothetical protein
MCLLFQLWILWNLNINQVFLDKTLTSELELVLIYLLPNKTISVFYIYYILKYLIEPGTVVHIQSSSYLRDWGEKMISDQEFDTSPAT